MTNISLCSELLFPVDHGDCYCWDAILYWSHLLSRGIDNTLCALFMDVPQISGKMEMVSPSITEVTFALISTVIKIMSFSGAKVRCICLQLL